MLRVGVLIFLFMSLHAEGMDDTALEGIYAEATWFVAVIAVMSLFSFVISRRQARKYEEEQRLKKLEQKEDILNEPVLDEFTDVDSESEVDKLLELSKLHKEGLLSKEEFMAFKLKLYRDIEKISP